MVATTATRVHEQTTSSAKRTGVGNFLVLGGSSLVLLPLILLLPLEWRPVSALMVFLALLINNPHFANSYQLFYRGFSARVSATAPAVQRRRYLYAGVAVPLVIVSFLGYCFVTSDLTALGLAGDAMAFFVGWHYVKQGYGMLMVDGARTRRFFSKLEKQALLANSYAVWFLTWVMTNGGGQNRRLRGIAFYSFDLPKPVEVAAIAITVVTSIVVAVVIWKRLASKRGLPVTGIIAYLVTLYLWMVAVHISPIWVLVVPALHSLQYLGIVWPFEQNRTRALAEAQDESAENTPRHPRGSRFALFILNGFVLALAGFWVIPMILDSSVHPSVAVPGGSFFMFAFWVFINIHHYFIDSVMWRSENQDVKRYLFAAAPSASDMPQARQAA